MHPCSAPRALRLELGVHLGPLKLLGWPGTCTGKHEARSAPGSARPESARAGRVMKWLGQDLLLSSLGSRVNEAAPGATSASPGIPGPVRSPLLHPDRPAEDPRSRAAPCARRTSIPSHPATAGLLLPLLKRCLTSENFVG